MELISRKLNIKHLPLINLKDVIILPLQVKLLLGLLIKNSTFDSKLNDEILSKWTSLKAMINGLIRYYRAENAKWSKIKYLFYLKAVSSFKQLIS